MRKWLINFLIVILVSVMLVIRIIDRDIFIGYNNLLILLGIVLVVISGGYFSFKLSFLQFNLFKMIRCIRKSNKRDIMALFMSLGGKIGIGSIAGVGLAIYLCGPGVLLWIWLFNLVSSILTYCENYLGLKYKNKHGGGVFYYLSQGVSNRWLAIIYTLILIFVYAVGFVGIQSNTVILSVEYIYNINTFIVCFLMVFIIFIIIFNKLSFITEIMSFMVPFMCLLYLGMGIVILLRFDVSFLDIFKLVIQEGLNIRNVFPAVIIVGMQRGMFASESGIGTASIVSSISNNKASNQALFQVIGVHFISFVIVTITGFIVIGSGYREVNSVNGIELVIDIFYKYFGSLGALLLLVIIFLFATSTIIGGYYYTIKGISFLRKGIIKSEVFLVKLFIVLLVLLGGLVNSTVIWGLLDSLIIFLLFINIYALIYLREEIKLDDL